MKAYCAIRSAPWYRQEAFLAGLRAAGHDVRSGEPLVCDRDTLLVIWNRYLHWDLMASRVERAGGTVLVCENGYIGSGGTVPKWDVHPKGPQPHHHYAIARGWHNGRGAWPSGDGGRWKDLGVELKPWRTSGEHVLVCGNRSFGVPPQIMPPDWPERCAERLRKQTARPVKIRLHPGNDAPRRPLSEDLKNCWAVVVWSSGAAVHALVAGIPVFVEAPFHVVKAAGASGPIDDPVMPDRLPHMERLGWAQWTCAEIERGEPFRRLIG